MDYVCVIGGANIDISCTPYTELKMRDSNPGKCRLSQGGVARNVAENLARLGIKVVFISVLGKDKYAEDIKSGLDEVGVDYSHCLIVDDGRTGTYVAINNTDNDMELGFSDMEILKNLTPDYLLTKLDIINKAKCVVMDTNIPECVQFLEKKCKVPLFMDTVSAKKTEAVKNILGRIFFIKPNLLEAEILSGVTYRTFGDLDLIAKKIHAKDIKRICISMGAEGVYFSDGNIRGIVPAIPTKVVNTTGAGDAFCAATVWAYLNGRGIKECTIVGCRAASLTILSEDTVSKEMCADKLIEAL